MENFVAFNPTKLHFGKDSIQKIGKTIKQYGQKVLLIYGKGSVVKYGYYKKITNELVENQIQFVEYSGIKPNPVIEDVYKAIDFGRTEKIDVILALGGGSVIDTAKIVSIAIGSKEDAWDIMNYHTKPSQAVPLITVLTLAATGTEMNAAAVVQNSKTQQKIGYVHPLMYPKESFLDPTFTFTVPKSQTAYGITDMIAHAMESFFAFGNSELSDKFVGAIIQEVMELAPLVLNNPENYDYRARILWASTCALNGTTAYGRKSSGDWCVHGIGHVLSYLFDTPHGATLSIAYIAWLKLHANRIPERIKKLGEIVFGDSSISVDTTIARFNNFFQSINCPVKLEQAGIPKEAFVEIVNLLIKNKVSGMNYPLSEDDYSKLVKLMYD